MKHGWPVRSYCAVHTIGSQIDRGLVTLTHDSAGAYRDRFELILRHRADRPNALWQAAHTKLKLLIVDAAGHPP